MVPVPMQNPEKSHLETDPRSLPGELLIIAALVSVSPTEIKILSFQPNPYTRKGISKHDYCCFY